MKYCPKCSKSYDDSWSICLHDQAALTDQKMHSHGLSHENIKSSNGPILMALGTLVTPLATPFYQALALHLSIGLGLRQKYGTDGTTIGMGIGIGFPGIVLSQVLVIIGYAILAANQKKRTANKFLGIHIILNLIYFIYIFNRGY